MILKASSFFMLAALASLAQADPGAALARETRSVSAFSQVVLRSSADLVIVQGDDDSLVVEAESRLLPQLTSEVKNGVLRLDTKGPGFSTRYPVRFLLTVKSVSSVAAEGSGRVSAKELRGDTLALRFSGSGSASIGRLEVDQLSVHVPGSADIAVNGGRARRQTIRIDGAASFEAPKLASEEATIAINGSGNVTVAVERKLNAAIAGSGLVSYAGDPQLTQNISGAGSVERVTTR